MKWIVTMMRILCVALIAASVAACGGGGSGGGGSSSDALFAGPLMYVGAQMRIYSDRGLQLADFNDDGLPELLYEDLEFMQTAFMPGSATELFGEDEFPNIGVLPAVADFDDDGILDMFTWIQDDTRRQRGIPGWSFVRGNGDNTFADPLPLDLAVDFGNLLVADINGDDFADLLALGYSNAIVPVVNQGDASFVPMPLVPVNAGRTAGVDINQDNFDDIIQLPFSPVGTVEIRLSLGDGTFGPVQTSVTADATIEPPFADLNGDGTIDLIGYSEAEGILGFLGQGDATFSAPIATETTPAFEAAFTRVIADFNDDSIPDLVYTAGETIARGQLADRTYLRLGRGDGTFDATPTLIDDGSTDILDALIMDVDRDGNLDLLLAVLDGGARFLRPYFGNGDGTFRNETPQSLETAGSAQLLPEREALFEDSTRPLDIDGDGNLDLVVLNNALDSLGVLFGNGDLTFEPEQRFPLNQLSPRLSLDVDVDGDVDFFGSFTTMDHWYNALRNYGGGELAALPGMFATSAAAQLHHVADFDQDGLTDLAFGFINGDLGVMYNLGSMQFEPMAITPAPGGGARQAVADVNGDGYPDIVGSSLLSNQAARLHVIPGGPGRVFGADVITDFSIPAQGDLFDEDLLLTVADLNGDGRDDLVWAARLLEDQMVFVKIFLGEMSGNLTNFQDLFVESIVFRSKTVDLDDDSDLDLVFASLSIEDLPNFFEPDTVRIDAFLNNGSGVFEYADGLRIPTNELFVTTSFAWDMPDVNADGYPDTVVYSARRGLAIALGRGDGTFLRPNYFRIGGGMDSDSRAWDDPVIGDFDNDGDADFAVMWAAGGSIEFIENRLVQD